MSIFNMDIIIPPVNIKFGENFCSLEFVDEIGDEGKEVCIMDSVFIDIVVVMTRVKTTVLFLAKKKGDACKEFKG